MSRRAISAGLSTTHAASLYGQLTTLFGGYGCVGLGITNAFGRTGMMTILPFRNKTWHNDHRLVNTYGMDQWNVHSRMFDPTKPAQLRVLMEPSDYVVYSAGRSVIPTPLRFRDLDWGYDAVYRLLPVQLAKMAKEMGKETFVYISMIGADVDSDSPVLRAKGRAEIEIREAFPESVIIRPSDVFSLDGGREADLFRKIAMHVVNFPVPIFPEMLNRRCKPVHNCDVGQAVCAALRDRSCYGKTFEIGGRQELTFEEILKYVSRVTKTPYDTFRLPFPAAKMLGAVLERALWSTGFPRDFFIRMQYDSMPSTSDPNVHGWADLGIDERDLMLMDEVLPASLFNWTNKAAHYHPQSPQWALASQRFTW